MYMLGNNLMDFVKENTVHGFRLELSPFVVNVCALLDFFVDQAKQSVVGFHIKMTVLALFDEFLLGFANELVGSSAP